MLGSLLLASIVQGTTASGIRPGPLGVWCDLDQTKREVTFQECQDYAASSGLTFTKLHQTPTGMQGIPGITTKDAIPGCSQDQSGTVYWITGYYNQYIPTKFALNGNSLNEGTRDTWLYQICAPASAPSKSVTDVDPQGKSYQQFRDALIAEGAFAKQVVTVEWPRGWETNDKILNGGMLIGQNQCAKGTFDRGNGKFMLSTLQQFVQESVADPTWKPWMHTNGGEGAKRCAFFLLDQDDLKAAATTQHGSDTDFENNVKTHPVGTFIYQRNPWNANNKADYRLLKVHAYPLTGYAFQKGNYRIYMENSNHATQWKNSGSDSNDMLSAEGSAYSPPASSSSAAPAPEAPPLDLGALFPDVPAACFTTEGGVATCTHNGKTYTASSGCF